MVHDRILKYIDYKGISKYKFYKITGLSNGFLDKKGNIGVDKCEIIYSHFPDLNFEWLVTGSGSMLKTDSTKKKSDQPNTEFKNLMSIIEAQKETIEALRETIGTQREQIEYLKTQILPMYSTDEIISEPASEKELKKTKKPRKK